MFTDVDRRALRSVGLQFWINGVVFASFIPRLPEIRDRLDIELDELGLLLTLGSIGGMVGSALVSRIIQPLGTRWCMTMGSLGLILALPFIGFATEPWMFLAALMTMQMFDVITDVAMNMQGSWLSGRRHVPVMNRLHGLWSLGTVVGGAVAALLASTIALSTHLVFVSIVLAATALYVLPGLLVKDELVPEDTSGAGARPMGRVALMFGLLALMAGAIEMVPADWAALRFVDDFGVSESIASLGFVAFTTGMVLGRFSGDSLTARLGNENFTRATVTVAVTGVTLATLINSAPVAVFGLFLAGSGIAGLFPRLYDDAAKAPGRQGVMLGAMTAGLRVALLIAPVLVGTLADTSLAVGSAMAIVAIPAGIGVLLLREKAT